MTREEFLELVSKNAPYCNLERIGKAFDFCKHAHEGQLRREGTPFYLHPVAVACIVAELNMDEDTIIAALLHDTVEDTEVTSEDLVREFGADVEKLVDGVTKLDSVTYESKQEHQVANLRKMFISMSSDIRVIIIKLADRLHNMRTLEFMSPAKQIEKSEETINIYAPIAHRLGIFKLKWELEDISLKYLDPVGYEDLIAKINKKQTERDAVISGYISQIKDILDKEHIKYEIYGRSKNYYSIYKKMKFQKKEFDEIYDITAIRIILEDEKYLYAVLGLIHARWNSIPGRFKDYVSTPKQNLYRSLHTTLMGNKEPFEVQIRTREMHEQAEYGIAAHWKYKEGGKNAKDDIDKKIQWFRQMMELQSDVKDSSEFMNSLKYDFLQTEVFVFTPNGEVLDLPEGSTPIDFAYKIHSGVGNNCIGAKVNGRIVPLSYQLQNGQIVEILTSKTSQGPSRDWLKIVKTTQARQKIKQWFKKERREENIQKGEEIILAELKRHNLSPKLVLEAKFIEPILKKLSVKSLEELYNTIGYGGLLTNQVIPRIKEKYKEIQPQQPSKPKVYDSPKKQSKSNPTGVIVKGADDILVRFAKCCSAVPGDEIIGYITRGRGVTVHRADCVNFEKGSDTENRFIEVMWAGAESEVYTANINIYAQNRKGLVSELAFAVAQLDMEIVGMNAKVSKDGEATVTLSVEISDKSQLNQIFSNLRKVPAVIDVERI